MKKLLLLALLFSNFAFADSDSDLNAAYQKSLKSNDAEFALIIKKSQRIWLKSRNENCKLFMTERGYDTDVSDLCLELENKSRIEFLTNLAN